VKGCGSIGGMVYDDKNNNGVYDAGEGIPNATVTIALFDRIYTVTTDANGNYVVNDLSLGTYTINVTLPTGFSGHNNISQTPSTTISTFNNGSVTNASWSYQKLCALTVNAYLECGPDEYRNQDDQIVVNIFGGTSPYIVSGSYTGTVNTAIFSITAISDPNTYSVSIIDKNGCTANSNSVLSNCTKQPVRLLFFKGEGNQGQNTLLWATGSETDNDFFTIERSIDGRNFVAIGRVKGNGTTVTRKDYRYVDKFQNNGPIYYRLTQTDFNGKATLHRIVVINVRTSITRIDNITPIPSINTIKVVFTSMTEHAKQITIYDVMGRRVYENSLSSGIGTMHTTIDISNLVSGVYYILLNDGENTVSQKIVKQ